MKYFILKTLTLLIKNRFLFKIFTTIRSILDNNIYTVNYSNIEFKFYNNSWITNYRYSTFKNKEPETLGWIKEFEDNTIFWDIGANIGLYSIFASKIKKNIKIYSFEPSPFNTELLVKNLYLNQCGNVTLVPIPLTDSVKSGDFKLSNITIGGALSVFSENYDQNGNEFSEILSFNVIGINIDNIKYYFDLTQPDYIKIDVDGIEHLIIEGGLKTIKNCKSILVEINKNFPQQYEKCNSFLTNLGFKKSTIENIGIESTNEIWKKL